MTLVNHLRGQDAQNRFIAVAYGKHMVTGHLTKSRVTGAAPDHTITVQQILGRGEWDGCEGMWFKGLECVPAKYKFYPGRQSTGMADPVQGQDSVFNTDTPHSSVAWTRAELPEGVGDADTKANPPLGLSGIFRTSCVNNFNAAGSVTDFGYATSPARQVADLILRIGGRLSSRIDWGAWAEWRDALAEGILHDYTFYVTHTHGAKLFVNNLAVPLIDEWGSTGTHSATIALSADQFYDIRLEWQHTTGNAELRLEWESGSQNREVISHRALYPKAEMRPRFETHPFFASPTRLDDAVRTILNLCNSTYQDVNGQIRFFWLGQLSASSFHFSSDMISNVKLRPRDVLSTRNTWLGRHRNIDSQYIEEDLDPLIIERPELITAAGRRIDGPAIELYNCTRHQAYRTLETLVRLAADSKHTIEFDGNADTFAPLPGDRVTIDLEFLDAAGKECLVMESHDASSETTADERRFTLAEWTL